MSISPIAGAPMPIMPAQTPRTTDAAPSPAALAGLVDAQSQARATDAVQRPQPASASAGVQDDRKTAGGHEATREEMEKSVKEISEFVGSVNASIQFSLDDDSGRWVMKVIDRATQDVIRQIPSEETLAISKALDSIKGLLIKQNT